MKLNQDNINSANSFEKLETIKAYYEKQKAIQQQIMKTIDEITDPIEMNEVMKFICNEKFGETEC